MAVDPLDGPIPGENLTSDTRNYPWHRPPQYTELDDALEYLFEQMSGERGSVSIISMLEMGFSVAMVTDLVVTKGISGGLWTVDMAILMAGPVAHMIILMARAYDVEFDLGVDEPRDISTAAFFKAAKEVDPQKAQEAGQLAEEQINQENPADNIEGGFMQGMGEAQTDDLPENPGEPSPEEALM